MPDCVKVLVVGQTPPPYHGQAIMIERLLQGDFTRVQLLHVRMAFSGSGADVGRFRILKVFHLVSIILQIATQRLVNRPTILYYPPAGANRLPLYRDLVILGCTRWMFRRLVLHLHATGIAELYPHLNWFTRAWFRRVLLRPDGLIRIAHCGDDDVRLLEPRRQFVVPNGIEDEATEVLNSPYHRFVDGSDSEAIADSTQRGWRFSAQSAASTNQPSASPIRLDSAAAVATSAVCDARPLRILFIGMLRESKGLRTLLEACGALARHNVPFKLEIAGEFQSPQFAANARDLAQQLCIAEHVNYLGIVSGAAKWQAYARADLLCFPTFYEAETFPLVVLEAMSFGLPVVATRWRGIPEIVDDGATGFTVDVKDATALADRLEQLQADPGLRQRLGQAGREKFLKEFTVDRFWRRMEDVFVQTEEAA
jgi:glycosyltransferase involved in cell wall biosynthesis